MRLPRVVFHDEDHVEILQLEMNTFEMDEFHFVENDHEWRLDKQRNE
jgi:hypothetical protein